MTVTPNNESENTIFCTGSFRRSKETGQLELVIDARSLHEHLRSIGIPTGSSVFSGVLREVFLNGPGDRTTNVVNSRGELADHLFLRVPNVYPLVVPLAGEFDTPPSYAELKSLCMSANVVVKNILAHYEPLDICFTIHKTVGAAVRHG